MVRNGRIVGMILMVSSLILLVGFLRSLATALGNSETTGGVTALGTTLILLLLLPIFGIGVYVYRKETAKQREGVFVKKKRKS